MPSKSKGKSSADYYKENPSSYKKKLEYDTKYNSKPDKIKKRSELVKINRDAQKRGTGKIGDGKDFDHSTGRMVNASTNRGRTGKNGTPGTKGDKKARGGKK